MQWAKQDNVETIQVMGLRIKALGFLDNVEKMRNTGVEYQVVKNEFTMQY